jgi:flagellar biosynthesis protein FlhF
MKIRRYVANSLTEAKEKIKKDLGDNAVILSSRKSKQRGIWRWFGRQVVEVTAAVDEPELFDDGNPSAGSSLTIAAASERAPWEVFQKDLAETKRLMHSLTRKLGETKAITEYPAEVANIYDLLKQAEVDDQVAHDLSDQIMEGMTSKELEDAGKVWRRTENVLTNLLDRYVRKPEPKRSGSQVICLVGPTGVGKTTTLAKLAAQAVLVGKKRVALVTFDTYRIAAVDQLKTYGEILGIPVEIAFSPAEIRQKLDRLRDYDTVFVDTVGRSQQNAMQLSEIKAFTDAVSADEVFLVQSATTRYDIMVEVTKNYLQAKPTALLFTKLDEARVYGPLLNLLLETGLPLSYLTNGQNVPDDIVTPKSGEIVQLLLGASGA